MTGWLEHYSLAGMVVIAFRRLLIESFSRAETVRTDRSFRISDRNLWFSGSVPTKQTCSC